MEHDRIHTTTEPLPDPVRLERDSGNSSIHDEDGEESQTSQISSMESSASALARAQSYPWDAWPLQDGMTGNTKLWAWKYFKKYGDARKQFAVCMLCKFPNGANGEEGLLNSVCEVNLTASLTGSKCENHLRAKHRTTWDEYQEKEAQAKVAEAPSLGISSNLSSSLYLLINFYFF